LMGSGAVAGERCCSIAGERYCSKRGAAAAG